MNNRTYTLALFALALILVGAGCQQTPQTDTVADIMLDVDGQADEQALEDPVEEPVNDGSVEEEDQDRQGEVVELSSPGVFRDYDAALLSRANSGDVVLFFHAAWCPTCKALNADIEGSLDDIPSDVTILKTDYDTQIALRQKYGVTVQHTMVQVDADGNLIKKWSGGNTLESVLGNL